MAVFKHWVYVPWRKKGESERQIAKSFLLGRFYSLFGKVSSSQELPPIFHWPAPRPKTILSCKEVQEIEHFIASLHSIENHGEKDVGTSAE